MFALVAKPSSLPLFWNGLCISVLHAVYILRCVFFFFLFVCFLFVVVVFFFSPIHVHVHLNIFSPIGKYAVTRSCYNSTAATITQECTEMFHGMSCYCVPKQGEKTCNGQSRVAPLYLTYLGLFVVLMLGYLKF